MRSIYHIREYNVRRLSLLTTPKIILSHDWPQAIEHHGNIGGLFKRKPYFKADSESGQLGSPPLMGLLRTLKPEWWFSAHLHVRFEASVMHAGGVLESKVVPVENPDEILIDDEDEETADTTKEAAADKAPVVRQNDDEIVLDDEEEEVAPPPPAPSITRFLALDKCLPRRQFLEVSSAMLMSQPYAETFLKVIDVPTSSDAAHNPNERYVPKFTFDPEWLAITRAFHPLLSTNDSQPPFPDESTARASIAKELSWIKEHVGVNGILDVQECQQFIMTAPGPGSEGKDIMQQRKILYTEFAGQLLIRDHSSLVHESANGSVLQNDRCREQDQPSSQGL